MQEGKGSVIEYIWTDGIVRFAQFRNTDYSSIGPIISTVDPNWYVWHRDDGNNAEIEWLNYITLDGSLWKSRLHCQLQIPSLAVRETINCWFEHEQYPNGDSHDDGVIVFLDWERHPWQAQINRVGSPFPAQPTFTLKRL